MTVSTGTAAVVRAGEGRAVRWGPAGVVRVLAGADSTEGCFSLVEVTEEPGSAAPLHVHHAEAEGFYILQGTLQLTCGEDTVTATAGDFVYTPKDVPHKYEVVGQETSKILLLFSRPGFESFFLEAGAPLDQPPAGPPDPDAFRRVVEKYELELLETPGD
jgi:mannose-6-phosphate isomerase-like protein (cupin superfamily)